MRKDRNLPDIFPGENRLPWVDRIKPLGNVITNKNNILEDDINQKKAKYISRSCEINQQELYFAENETLLTVNDIYNSSWFGSVLWDYYSTSFESCYNIFA